MTRTYVSRHLPPVPVFGTAREEEGWVADKPGNGRITGIRSLVFSDGSSRKFYRVEAAKPKQKRRKLRKAA